MEQPAGKQVGLCSPRDRVAGLAVRMPRNRCSPLFGRRAQRVIARLAAPLAVLLLSACTEPAPLTSPPGGGGGGAPVAPSPVAPNTLRDIVNAFVARRRIRIDGNTEEAKLNRLMAMFVRLRARSLGAADPSWVDPAHRARFDTRIDSEIAEVSQFLRDKLGTTAARGPLGGGADPVAPGHVDLSDVARVKNTTPAATARRRAATYLALRKDRVRMIVWRAAGLHAALWQPVGEGATATLNRAPLETEVDRRLRVMERMSFQVASAHALIDRDERRERTNMVTNNNPSGPWLDGFRVRIFEYPRIQKWLANTVGAANIAKPTVASYGPGKPWQWESLARQRMHYNVPPTPGLRFAPAAAADWQVSPVYDYNRQLVPADGSLAAALDRLFRPAEDWWQRSWLFCDHVVTALHIEGLRFGLRRREGNDARFDTIAGNPAVGPVLIGALLWVSGNPGGPFLIAGQAADPYFEQTLIAEDDVQAADHLIIWNSWLYTMVGRGEWRLENSIVMGIDHDPVTGKLIRERLALQGHGIGQKLYPAYQTKIAHQTNLGMREAQKAVRDAMQADATITRLRWTDRDDRLIRWDPYGSFPGTPGAWWIKIVVPDNDRLARWSTIAEAQTAIPGAISDADARGAPGYTPPPDTAHVYFPLYAPHMPDPNGGRDRGWTEFLRIRKTGSTSGLPTRLHPVAIDGTMMPGLFFRGQGTPFAVIRTRVVL